MRSTALLSGITLQPGTLRAVLLDRLTRSLGKDPETATQRDIYDALSLAVREELAARWLATQRRVSQAGVKRVCYLSVEYLLGRSLINGLASLDGDLVQEAREALAELGYDLERVAQEEIDPGLGNGGLGRLAACFLDSLATLQYPAVGYGIRYDYGIFTQVIDEDGRQREIASTLAARAQPVGDRARRRPLRRALRRPLHRHAGRAGPHALPLGRDAEHLGRRLRPADPGQPQPDGQSPAALGRPRHRAVQRRGVQCRPARRGLGRRRSRRRTSRASCTRTTRRRRARNCASSSSTSSSARACRTCWRSTSPKAARFDSLPDAISIQLNDTHPALAIPELMRLLVDEHEVEWEQAWNITRRVFSYTNHTLLPEALEVWPVAFFERHPAAPPADHLPDQPRACSTRSRRASPNDNERRQPHVADRRGPRPPGAHGASRGRREPHGQRRRQAPLRADDEDDLHATSPSCIRTASPTSRTASPCGAGSSSRTPGCRR